MANDNPIPEMSALRVNDDYNLWVADDNGSSLHIFKTDGEDEEVFYTSVGLTENNCSYGGMNRIIFHDEKPTGGDGDKKPDPIPAPVSDQAQKIIDALDDLSDADLKRVYGAAGANLRNRNAPKCPMCGRQLQGRFKEIGLCLRCEQDSQKAKKQEEKKEERAKRAAAAGAKK